MGRNISVNFGGDTGSVKDARVGLTVATRVFGSLRLECEKEPPQPDDAMAQIARNLVMTTLKDEMMPRAAIDLRLLVGDHEPLRQALEARLNQATAGQGIKVVVVDLEITIAEEDRKQIVEKYAALAATTPVAAVTPPPVAAAAVTPPTPTPVAAVTPPAPRPASSGGWSTDIQQGYEPPPAGSQPLNIWSGPSMMRPQAAPPVGEKTCGSCGAKVAATAHFCNGCGNKI